MQKSILNLCSLAAHDDTGAQLHHMNSERGPQKPF